MIPGKNLSINDVYESNNYLFSIKYTIPEIAGFRLVDDLKINFDLSKPKDQLDFDKNDRYFTEEKTYIYFFNYMLFWNLSPDSTDPPDQVLSTTARDLPSTRAGGQDDVGPKQTPSK